MIEIKCWKAKFSCPVCGKLEKIDFPEKDEWFVHDHMAKEHTTDELASQLVDALIRVHLKAECGAWLIEDVD